MKRYRFIVPRNPLGYPRMDNHEEGEYVLFTDHEAELKKKDEDVQGLVSALEAIVRDDFDAMFAACPHTDLEHPNGANLRWCRSDFDESDYRDRMENRLQMTKQFARAALAQMEGR